MVVTTAIDPLESWTSRAHTVREEMEPGLLKEAQVEISGEGEGRDPKTRRGRLYKNQKSHLKMDRSEYPS